MSIKPSLYSLLILLFSITNANCQDSTIELSGIVVAENEDTIGIPFVHIINKSTNRGMVTDEDGLFILNVQPGDSIQFSYIGFEDVLFIASVSQIIQIKLPIAVNELPDHIVRAMPTTINSLKQAVNNLRIYDETDVLKQRMLVAGFKPPPVHIIPPKPNPIMNPISFFYEKVVEKIKEKKKKPDVMPKWE